MRNTTVGKSSPTGLYVLAVLIPIAGVIWGVIWWSSGDTDEKREWGRTGFCVAAIAWIFSFLVLCAIGGSQ